MRSPAFYFLGWKCFSLSLFKKVLSTSKYCHNNSTVLPPSMRRKQSPYLLCRCLSTRTQKLGDLGRFLSLLNPSIIYLDFRTLPTGAHPPITGSRIHPSPSHYDLTANENIARELTQQSTKSPRTRSHGVPHICLSPLLPTPSTWLHLPPTRLLHPPLFFFLLFVLKREELPRESSTREMFVGDVEFESVATVCC